MQRGNAEIYRRSELVISHGQGLRDAAGVSMGECLQLRTVMAGWLVAWGLCE